MPLVSNSELAKRRQDILENARRCFAEHGYEGATVRRLEQFTGKSRGAIFHHFGDKESLFLAIAAEDAERQADIVSREGLVEVMRDILHHPERHDWLATRLEITRLLRTDDTFRSRWQEHQTVLDEAVRRRLQSNADNGLMRHDVPVDVLTVYLETVMDGLISRLSSGETQQVDIDNMEGMLRLVEVTIRGGETSY